MKKWFPLLLAVLLLSGCGFLDNPFTKTPSAYAVEIDGAPGTVTFAPDTYDAGAITLESGTFSFRRTTDADDAPHLEILYPDGTVCLFTYLEDGSREARYDGTETPPANYPDGDALLAAIESAYRSSPAAKRGPSLIVAVFLIFIGLFHTLFPQRAWDVLQRWASPEDREPPELAITLYQFGGAALTAVGVLCGVIAVIRHHWI